jgi:hypothetical protein
MCFAQQHQASFMLLSCSCAGFVCCGPWNTVNTGSQSDGQSNDIMCVMFVILQVLGLSDEDAAPVHIEVGRRLSRIGFEYKVIQVTCGHTIT